MSDVFEVWYRLYVEQNFTALCDRLKRNIECRFELWPSRLWALSAAPVSNSNVGKFDKDQAAILLEQVCSAEKDFPSVAERYRDVLDLAKATWKKLLL